MSPGWPVTLEHGSLKLRPLRLRDAADWRMTRLTNREWLEPWEATTPGVVPDEAGRGYADAIRALRRDARIGLAYPFALMLDEQFAGQVTVGAIARGSANSAYLGYWLSRSFAGRGIMPTALALVVDHCFGPAGLHRVEANIRPENVASRRVVEKLGFRMEGTRERYIHISGFWRDHLSYALTVEDVPGGLMRRWLAQGGEARVAGGGPSTS
ncbi:MAG: [ribosomal protein S5]-alanine N-acetyltransferase [Actinomycetota bacterium]|jgi:ribosomal-protein-alanine N-acetyltransferase|nr:[ribosomal protein S5]-alanine N-acetyltransferase [Actinomycetota bacterium]